MKNNQASNKKTRIENEEKHSNSAVNGKRTSHNVKDNRSLKIKISNIDGNGQLLSNDLGRETLDDELFSDKSYRKIKKIKKNNTFMMKIENVVEKNSKMEEEIFVDDEEI